MIRVLFVDDEPNILLGLQRMLRSMRAEWQMEFAEGGEQALELMKQAPFDVIVSDMRMPGMNGVQLLDEVRKRHPTTARIILSGQAEHSQILQVAGNTHQYLAKPCDELVLKEAIGRSCAMRELLNSDQLRRIVSQAQCLPTLPALYSRILAAVQSEASLREIGELISQDIAISSKILQLINSAFFGAPRRIANVSEAVSALGIETVKALILSEGVFSAFPRDLAGSLSIDKLWMHSAQTAAIAKSVARLERVAVPVVDEAFTAAFLHDVGKLLLSQNLTDDYIRAQVLADSEKCMDWQAETELLGASHADVGAYLLALWGLPASTIEAIAWHHQPALAKDAGFGITTVVHVANALAHESSIGREAELASVPDRDYLSQIGVLECLPAWRKAILEGVGAAAPTQKTGNDISGRRAA